jgi:HD superfamily phosphohydrolase
LATNEASPKAFNDPIWGTIELYPWETILLDSPLIQRLRGIRQLGLAHYVYPGASHSRLEHTLGVVEASERMIQALVRNADHRRIYGDDPDEGIPVPSDRDRYSIRLAALLHDIGHGPLSHVTEPVIEQRYKEEFERSKQLLRDGFAGVAKIASSEVLAVLMVMSTAIQRIFEDARFGVPCAPLVDLITRGVIDLRATFLIRLRTSDPPSRIFKNSPRSYRLSTSS